MVDSRTRTPSVAVMEADGVTPWLPERKRSPGLGVSGVAATPPLRRGDVLAAYGLLRPSAGRLAALGLGRALAAMGPCRIPGRLLDMGAYPALIMDEGAVAGELLRVLDPAAGPRLDAFEEFDADDPARSLYRRVRVRLLNPPREAWVYVWNRPPRGEPRVVSGDWMIHARGRARVSSAKA